MVNIQNPHFSVFIAFWHFTLGNPRLVRYNKRSRCRYVTFAFFHFPVAEPAPSISSRIAKQCDCQGGTLTSTTSLRQGYALGPDFRLSFKQFSFHPHTWIFIPSRRRF